MIRTREMARLSAGLKQTLQRMQAALDAYEASQADAELLYTYMESDDFERDRADSDHGFVAPEIKAEALNEAEMRQTLDAYHALAERMEAIASRVLNADK